MANHLRRQIREAIGATLTGLATTGTRVFQSRLYPLAPAELPGLLIYTRSERSQPITIHPQRQISRTLFVDVAGVAKADADLDDLLDQIAKEVETALAWPVAGLLALAKDVSLTETQIAIEEAEKPTGRVRLTYQVEYCNVESAPDVAT